MDRCLLVEGFTSGLSQEHKYSTVGEQITVEKLIELSIVMRISRHDMYIGIRSATSRPTPACIYYYYSTHLLLLLHKYDVNYMNMQKQYDNDGACHNKQNGGKLHGNISRNGYGNAIIGRYGGCCDAPDLTVH